MYIVHVNISMKEDILCSNARNYREERNGGGEGGGSRRRRSFAGEGEVEFFNRPHKPRVCLTRV